MADQTTAGSSQPRLRRMVRVLPMAEAATARRAGPGKTRRSPAPLPRRWSGRAAARGAPRPGKAGKATAEAPSSAWRSARGRPGRALAAVGLLAVEDGPVEGYA